MGGLDLEARRSNEEEETGLSPAKETEVNKDEMRANFFNIESC